MRETVVTENGDHPFTHHVGDAQCMQFKADDEGPFNLTPEKRLMKKNPTPTGRVVTKKKTKGELLNELKQQNGFTVSGYYTFEQLENQARNFNLPLEKTQEIVEPGWVGANKGLLQVLWERGFVDATKLSEYTLEGKKSWKDENGNIRDEHKPYLLRNLMASCSDFKNELSAMELLCQELSAKGECKIELIVSPKYHPEIAGEGVEYVWGFIKKYYRSLSMKDKKGKKNFEEAIKKSVSQVNKNHVNRFAARCRRYMLAYMNQARETRDSPPNLTYHGIEKFQKNIKTHRNTADQD